MLTSDELAAMIRDLCNRETLSRGMSELEATEVCHEALDLVESEHRREERHRQYIIEARETGREAKRGGATSEANPYKDEYARREWLRGWLDKPHQRRSK